MVLGVTSHSAIFQLYSDGTVVYFPKREIRPAAVHPKSLAAGGLLRDESTPTRAWVGKKTSLISFSIRGPVLVNICLEANTPF